ncbi:chaperonin 10-like protein [Thelonectria olida]|uniref:Chaperonin 10-like protein n=1 Tax=Thelonectria olida TaxID=1576542 RepID=A0A9P9ANP7_9HYPO|nr:chaperonin 10-like protein [Thelonectria olida]
MKALVTNRNIASRLINMACGKAICGPGAHVVEVAKPTISDNEILVKVKAVALNPTDFKNIDAFSPPGSVVGCDYAGQVAQVGANAASRWKIGDRVAGLVHGGISSDRGAFAEFLKTDADLAWHVPDEMSDAEASTYGISAVTAMLSLNLRLNLPWANESETPVSPAGEGIFIYGGSTSAGLSHIQLAKAIGYTVITTASPRSFDLVKAYGADAVFDYHSPSVAQEIAKGYSSIGHAVDCYSEGMSTAICAQVIKNKGGKVVTLLPTGKSKTAGVEYDWVVAYTLFGRSFQILPPLGPKFEANVEDRKGLARFYATLPKLVPALRPPPITVSEGGFEDLLDGLDKLRQHKVSGGKLVVMF